MRFPVCVFFNAGQMSGQSPSGDDTLRHVSDALAPFRIDTDDSRYLAPKKVSVARYSRQYRNCVKNDSPTFDDWMKSVGCYRLGDGNWARDVNLNGRWESFELGGAYRDYIPTEHGGSFLCRAKDILAIAPDDSGEIRKSAEREYFHMTRTAPSNSRLRELFRKKYGCMPTASELDEYRDDIMSRRRREAVHDGCNDASLGVVANRERFPTFDDYYAYRTSFVPECFVADGKWVEVERASKYHGRPGRNAMLEQSSAFSEAMSSRVGDDGWFLACVDAGR